MNCASSIGDYHFEATASNRAIVIPLQVFLVLVSVYVYVYGIFGTPVSALIIMCTLVLRDTKTEKVLVLDGLGVQTSQYGMIRGFSDKSAFFSKNSIQACVINEVFEGVTVNYVIQIIEADKDELSLVLPTIRPKLADLSEIWRRINDI